MSLGGTKGKARDNAKVNAKYQLYGNDLSFFTQKVRSALQWYYHSEFEFRVKDLQNGPLLETRAGTHQIPVLVTPENWCLADSTPIFKLLDNRLRRPRLYPCDPLTAAVAATIEEYFDEWMARLTVHTRWHYQDSSDFAAASFMRDAGVPAEDIPEMLKSPQSPANWGKRVCRALGMTSERQIAAGEEELLRIHTALDQHLATHRYVLGDAPCAIDAVLMGGLRAHFLIDPWPRRFLAGLEHLRRWASDAEWPRPVSARARATPVDPAHLSPLLDFVFREMGGGFRAFVLGNARGLATGSKAFVAEVYGEEVSYLVRPYVEKSRRMLRRYTDRILEGDDRKRYTQLLHRYNLYELYSPLGDSSSSKL